MEWFLIKCAECPFYSACVYFFPVLHAGESSGWLSSSTCPSIGLRAASLSRLSLPGCLQATLWLLPRCEGYLALSCGRARMSSPLPPKFLSKGQNTSLSGTQWDPATHLQCKISEKIHISLLTTWCMLPIVSAPGAGSHWLET